MNLINKITQMIKQAFISKVTDDSDKLSSFPIAEVSYHNKRSKAIRFSPYGLCTNAPLDSNVILLSANGQESLKYALSDDMQNRFKNLKEGEVVLFNYMSGSYIYLKENGDIETECKKDEKIDVVGDANIDIGGDADITVGGDATLDVIGSLAATAGTTADVTAPTINLTGNVIVTGTFNVAGGNAATFSGTLGVTGESTFDGIPFSTHDHTQPDTGADATVQGDTGGPK